VRKRIQERERMSNRDIARQGTSDKEKERYCETEREREKESV
jgi:hypothetical protein